MSEAELFRVCRLLLAETLRAWLKLAMGEWPQRQEAALHSVVTLRWPQVSFYFCFFKENSFFDRFVLVCLDMQRFSDDI